MFDIGFQLASNFKRLFSWTKTSKGFLCDVGEVVEAFKKEFYVPDQHETYSCKFLGQEDPNLRK